MASKKSSKTNLHDYSRFLLRLALGFNMLWGFLDKTFGLGFATKPESSWLNGASPTTGFLKFGTHGPFSEIYQSLAGNQFVDWLFMLGLLGIGLAFIFGFAMRFAGYMGALMMLLMYFALVPPEHNPIIDEHMISAFAFIYLGTSNMAGKWGLAEKWNKSKVAKALPFLR